MTTITKRFVVSVSAVAVLVGLTACGQGTPVPGPSRSASSAGAGSSSTSSSGSSSGASAPAAVSFVLPSGCTALLGSDLENQFLAQGNVLFSGPGGTGIYSPIASTQTGGSPLSCWYGKDMVDLSTFEIAVQPLTQDAHEGTLAVLHGGGFTETTNGDVVTFTQVGDEGTKPAIVHVLHPDSWITIFSTFGGAAQVAKMNSWLATVTANVYPVP